VSRPTAKQLASWLKEADKATGLLELSITGLVFMAEPGFWRLAMDFEEELF